MINRIQQNLRLQTSGVITRVVLSIDQVVVVWLRTELVSAGAGDLTHQTLQVETAADKVFFQSRQQFRIRRRIRVANVIFGLDQPSSKEVLPVTIHQSLREERVRR